VLDNIKFELFVQKKRFDCKISYDE
jgi:hypothetical protein